MVDVSTIVEVMLKIMNRLEEMCLVERLLKKHQRNHLTQQSSNETPNHVERLTLGNNRQRFNDRLSYIERPMLDNEV